MSMHCVIYTDGSARPNPGNIGWGVHGYMYQNITEKPVLVQKYTITNHGYLYSEKFKKDTQAVEPIEYIDIVGSLDTRCGTNNQAEISAIKACLEALKDKEILSIYLNSDSEYAINMINDYLKNKKKPNFSANMALWTETFSIIDIHVEKGNTLSFNWVKGHSDNVGNDISDYLSVIGTNHSIDEKQILNIKFSPAKKYWDIDIEDNPLLSFNRCYFNSQSRFNIVGQYFIADPGPNDLLLGKRTSETGLAVVKLREPDSLIETIKDNQFAVSNDVSSIIMVSLDKIYTPSVYKYLTNYGKYCLLKNKRFNSLDFIDGKPLTTEINPVGLSLKAIEAFNTLESILDNYQAGSTEGVHHVDISDTFYETEEKKNKISVVLKKDIVMGMKNIHVDIDIQDKKIKVPLMLSIDIPNRNKLKKLEKYNPKIKLIIWSITPVSFRYCTLIDTDLGTGVWSNYYADRIFHL